MAAITTAQGAPTQLITNLDAGLDQKLVVYGTSLTQNGAWSNVTVGSGGLYDWLRARYGTRITMINSGMAGKASNTAVANLNAKVISKNPNTVIIEFAMNDASTNHAVGDPDHAITVAQSKANLNTMIDAIEAANPDTEIILQTMNPVIDVPPSQAATLRPFLSDYYEGYREVALARGLLLIDHYENWDFLLDADSSRFRSLVPDGLHPASTGSLTVTLPAMQKALLGTAPTPSALASVVRTEGNTQAALFWEASSGAINYVVKRATISGGPYTTIASNVVNTTYINTGLTNGTTYYYVVSAANGFGASANSPQVSATPSTSGVVVVDNPSSAITYSGSWTHSADPCYFNGTKSVSTTSGNSATFTYTGTTISVYAKKLPSGGIIDVYVDGVLSGSPDTYSNTVQHNVGVFSKVLPAGSHTIEVRTTNRKNAASAGTSIGFDHFNYRP